MMFPTKLSAIEEKVRNLNTEHYAKTRNHKTGAVTKLSPYISRGFISTKQIFELVLSWDLPWYKTEKFVQELAWRDYWQQVWIAKGNEIDKDLKYQQTPVVSHQMPKAVVDANTGIESVDEAINELYETGYMHNHMRMYVASICCNIAQTHWSIPAKWMYSHLLDADWASNALSWQWVAGANANKKYVANQENINNFFDSKQKNTFLDVKYSEFESLEIPEILKVYVPFDQKTMLPETEITKLENNKKTLIYNYYNIDPKWYENENDIQRVLLLEPSFFEKYVSSKKSIDFVLELSKNIKDIKILVGEFSELEKQVSKENIIYKEHPTNADYQGTEEERDWMFGIKGYYPSFFSFWKKCKKEFRASK